MTPETTQTDQFGQNALQLQTVRDQLIRWLGAKSTLIVVCGGLGSLSVLLLAGLMFFFMAPAGPGAPQLPRGGPVHLLLICVLVLVVLTILITRRHRSVRRGLSLYGLWTCPGCGHDTRDDAQQCKVCTEADERTDFPGFWIHFIEYRGGQLPITLPSKQSLQGFISIRQDVSRRRERQNTRELVAAGVLLAVAVGAGFVLSPQFYSLASYPALVYLICIGARGALPNHFSQYGYCVHCKYELPPSDRPSSCTECGKSLGRGSIVFAYSDRFNPFWFVLAALVCVWITFSDWLSPLWLW